MKKHFLKRWKILILFSIVVVVILSVHFFGRKDTQAQCVDMPQWESSFRFYTEYKHHCNDNFVADAVELIANGPLSSSNTPYNTMCYISGMMCEDNDSGQECSCRIHFHDSHWPEDRRWVSRCRATGSDTYTDCYIKCFRFDLGPGFDDPDA